MSTKIELVPFALGDGSGVMVCCADDAMAIIAQRDARIAELETQLCIDPADVYAMERELAALKSQSSAVHLLFDGPPGPECGRFVEAEDASGRSINAGEWSRRPDGYWQLVIQRPCTGDLLAKIAELEQSVEVATTECVQQYRWRLEDSECGRDEINDGVDMLLARLKARPSGVVDEREEFETWRVDNFCGGIERLKKCSNAPDVYYYTAEQEAWRVWQARAGLNSCRAQAVPDVLFDGFAVYSALDAKAQGRTSPENVSDTLDAAVRLIRADAPSAQQKKD